MESEMENYLTFFLGKLCKASKSRDILKLPALWLTGGTLKC